MSDPPPKKKRGKSKILLALLILAAGFALLVAALFLEGREPFVISRETTWLVEPIGEDGHVDYIAALNQQLSEGVTVENNAVIPFWRVFGPKEIPESMREQFFEMLGMDALPEEGYYFEPFEEFARARDELDLTGQQRLDFMDRYRETQTRPWSREEFPLIAQWLDTHSEHIEQLVDLTRLTKMYSPLIATAETGKRPLAIAVLLPTAQQMRLPARIFSARAMLALQEGQVEEANEQIMAGHRLARLQGQGATLIDMLVAVALESIACNNDVQLVMHGNLTSKQAKRYLQELQDLPPLPPMLDKIDVAERYMFLDSVTAMMLGESGLSGFLNQQGDESLESLVMSLSGILFDWNEVFRVGNESYDRLSRIRNAETREERVKLLKAYNDDLEIQDRRMREMISNPLNLALESRKDRGRFMGTLMISLFLPAASAALDVEDRNVVRLQLTKLAYALAGYRADHGSYPGELNQLAPGYVESVPVDLFSGKELLHKPEEQGFLLYSVGKNGQDDGGLTFDSEPRGDDIVVDTRKTE